MKIEFASDIHLEFGGYELSGGDTLLLAGDVCVATYLKSNRTDKDSLRHKKVCDKFFFEECAKYDKVFYTFGNHEHYHGVFDETYDIISEFLMGSNVEVLNDRYTTLKNGWRLFGGTFWTNYNKNDWHTKHACRDRMADHSVIKKIKMGREVSFIPDDALDIHYRTIDKLLSGMDSSVNTIVMSHHAPHEKSVDEIYKGQTLINGGFFSDLEELILNNPNIKNWHHGHMHNNSDYIIGECRVINNSRGYHGHSLNNGFIPGMSIELPDKICNNSIPSI